MKKKKIKPEDLELNIEVTGKNQISGRVSVTQTCANTKNICMHTKKDDECVQCSFEFQDTCGTTTIDPTTTNQGEDCHPTEKCLLTIEPACETKVGCVDSASHAVLCCPLSDKANTVCENCHTAGTCGADSQCQCLISKNVCESDGITCVISGDDETCNCIYTLQDGCEPPVVATEITGCGLY